MKRDIFIHLAIFVSIFILFSIFRGWLSLSYWIFWVGGLVGTILPDIDEFIYVFFINPQELSSQRVVYLIKNGNFIGSLKLLFETKNERQDLIFHSIFFLIISLILFVWVLTSSVSVLGFGLILGICTHLLLDQIIIRIYHSAS